jgi:protein SCO1/2/putative membrane protein
MTPPQANQPDPTVPPTAATSSAIRGDSWKAALWWISGAVMWVAIFVLLYLQSVTARAVATKPEVVAPPATSSTVATIPLTDVVAPPLSSAITDQDYLPEDTIVEPGKELIPAKLQEFSLIERSGEPVTRETLAGEPFVCNFFFTKCVTSCPIITKKMHDLAQKFKGKPVRFVSFTVDPRRDDPKQLTKYAEIYGADPKQWLFVTGKKSELYNLIEKNFMVTPGEGASTVEGYEFAHSERFFHVDAEGNIVGSYLGTDDAQTALLARVLEGKAETPKKHRFFHTKAGAAMEKFPAPTEHPKMPGEKTVEMKVAPPWVYQMPLVNTTLNGLAGVLLLCGLGAIKSGQRELHKKIMLTAFGVSVAFLICYLSYHFTLHYYTGAGSIPYPGKGTLKAIYLSILLTHVLLAAIVPFLAITTIHKGLRQNWVSHRKWAKITFPIWLYVSITGIVIYVMLYNA